MEARTRTVIGVWLALPALFLAAVGARLVPLPGPVVTLSIAAAKATLVVWVFMHLRAVPGLRRVVALAGRVRMAVPFVIGLSDRLARRGRRPCRRPVPGRGAVETRGAAAVAAAAARRPAVPPLSVADRSVVAPKGGRRRKWPPRRPAAGIAIRRAMPADRERRHRPAGNGRSGIAGLSAPPPVHDGEGGLAHRSQAVVGAGPGAPSGHATARLRASIPFP